jgi:hypothetical protein
MVVPEDDMETMTGRKGKISTMDVTTLDEDTRKYVRRSQERAERVTGAQGLGKNDYHRPAREPDASLRRGWRGFRRRARQARGHYEAEAGDDPDEWFV